MARKKNNHHASTAGPIKGDFIASPEVEERDERADALPAQEEFWKPPTRFGSVPVSRRSRWAGTAARASASSSLLVMLPFQVVERVSFGHSQLEPNRLFWGDNSKVGKMDKEGNFTIKTIFTEETGRTSSWTRDVYETDIFGSDKGKVGEEKGTCFLTTACVEYAGLHDNCWELQMIWSYDRV